MNHVYIQNLEYTHHYIPPTVAPSCAMCAIWSSTITCVTIHFLDVGIEMFQSNDLIE